jgi:hypothetical protein
MDYLHFIWIIQCLEQGSPIILFLDIYKTLDKFRI